MVGHHADDSGITRSIETSATGRGGGVRPAAEAAIGQSRLGFGATRREDGARGSRAADSGVLNRNVRYPTELI